MAKRLRLFDPAYPPIPWPVHVGYRGTPWHGYWREHMAGAYTCFGAVRRVFLYRLIGQHMSGWPRWYNWLWGRG